MTRAEKFHLTFNPIHILISAIFSYLMSGRTGTALGRVVQRIDTLVEFDRGTKPTATMDEADEGEELEEPPSDVEEEIS